MSPRHAEGHLESSVPSGLAGRSAIPPLVAVVLVIGYVTVEALGCRGMTRLEGDTVSEAAALGHAARTLELIAAGQNPNQPLRVRAGILDDGEYELRPLEAAVLGRHAELVRLLARTGAAQFDTTRASCFARARLPEVLPELGTTGSESAEPIEIAAAVKMCETH